ncbi:glycosyl hydrolase family 95 catalytic domain-containing protein [Radiobacillus sp. PE A8.2]|uniref:glycosyl hydrolase family 95 catalytic domain-containing protein n=1 Tax=Radiobacillus sp. PE A8.2 TaxID=3380349 RepID=UPI003890E462
MKKSKWNILVLLGVLLCTTILQSFVTNPTLTQAATQTSDPTPIFNPDYSELIGRSDLTHTGRITTGTQGMPIANGRFGGPVWQSSGNTLTMQLNHTDTFMFNDASAESQHHTNAGGGALGRVHINLGQGSVFDDSTEHHLSLYDGKLSVNGNGVDVKVIPNMESDAIAIQITDNRDTPGEIGLDLTMLRDENQIWGAHSAISTLTAEQDDTMVVLEQVIQEEADTGIEVNDHYVNTAVAATVQGRDVTSISDSMVGNRKALRLNLPAQNGTFTVIIGGESTMDETVDAKDNAITNAVNSADYDTVYASTQNWWSDFWDKSYIYLPSHKDFEQRRNYYMYLAAISNRGNYPSKYNGGIWIGEEDTRDWGSFFWNWNQDSLYQPFLSANHTELLEPMFKMRESSFEQYETAASQMWGAEGIYIPETAGILGWETLPDNIADAVQEYITFETDTRSQEYTDFTKNRNTFLAPWNWNIFGSNNQASYVSHTMMATQETAEYYWQVYHYTKDLDFLAERAYPFIKGAAELYRTYGDLKLEEDGKYHFYNTNLHEHIWAGKDVIDDLSMARGVFAAVIEASELLGVDEEMRSEWEEIRDNLADYPLRSDPGALWAGSTNPSLAEILETDEPAWAQGLTPSYFIRDLHGTESPIFKMLEKYDVLNLETRDQGLDDGDWEIALNTYLHSPGYENQVENERIDRNGSSRFHVDAAKLGRSDDMEMILNTQYGVFSTYGEYPNLLFDQLDYYSAEGYGTYSAALQEALNQSLSPTPVGDPVIRVFPAWPEAWDAKYKLLAKDGFLVSSSMESGDIQYVEIESELGKTARIRNPWNSDVVLYRDGVKSETLPASENDLLEFDTYEGENIVLVRPGTTPDTYRTSELEESVYTVANNTNGNIDYTGSWEYSDARESDDYANDVHYTSDNGDSAEFTFYGAGIDFITEMGPDMGEVEVYINGNLHETVNNYSEETSYQQTSYINVGLDYGRHTIRLVKKSGERMVVDAFGVRLESGASNVNWINDNDLDVVTYENASGATSQNEGAWFYTNNRSGEGAYKGDAHISGNSSSGGIGNYVELEFFGTGVEYITERNNDMGEVDVYIDDVYQDTVTAHKTGGRDSQYVLYSTNDLPLGDHTLKLVKKSGQYMIVDAFKVLAPNTTQDVTYIRISEQPKLTYDEGSALDLSEMEIIASYSDGSMETLSFNDEGVSVQLKSGESIANGDILTKAEHDSRTLTISYGGRTVTTEPISVVYSADTEQLEDALDTATDLVDQAVIGEEPGQYPQEAVDTLEAAITAAEAVLAEEATDQAAIDAAVKALEQAIEQFENEVIPASDLTGIIINLEKKLLEIGETAQFEVMAEYSNDSQLDVTDEATYSSSDDSIVTVSSSGEISAVGTGEAQITITYQDEIIQVSVKVYDTEITLGESMEVIAGKLYRIKGSMATIKMPDDLPTGTMVTINQVDEKNLSNDGYVVAGDVYDVNFTYPSGSEFDGSFTLTLEYNSEQYSEDEVNIYYLDENSGEWELRGGQAIDGVITLDVPHFSIYGVFAEAEQQPEPPVDGEDKDQDEAGDEDKDQDETGDEDKELPNTATSTFNWLAIGLVFVIAGAGLLLVIRRKYKMN